MCFTHTIEWELSAYYLWSQQEAEFLLWNSQDSQYGEESRSS